MSFTVGQQGSIQYNIYVNDTCTACTYYWNNTSLSGDYDYFCNFDTLNRTINSGVVVYTISDHVSGRVDARIIAPVTGTYTFTCEHDDGCNVTVGGTDIINNWSYGVFTTTGTINLVQNQEYDVVLYWNEGAGGAHYRLYWQYGSNAIELVPLVVGWNNYESIIGNSPYTVTVDPPLCSNGVIDSGEECDDGNAVSGDG